MDRCRWFAIITLVEVIFWIPAGVVIIAMGLPLGFWALFLFSMLAFAVVLLMSIIEERHG